MTHNLDRIDAARLVGKHRDENPPVHSDRHQCESSAGAAHHRDGDTREQRHHGEVVGVRASRSDERRGDTQRWRPNGNGDRSMLRDNRPRCR